MELTEKAKEQFIPFVEQIYSYEDFVKLPDPMKWGVYVDFFDSVGVDVDVMSYTSTKNGNIYDWQVSIDNVFDIRLEQITRQEARTAAIEKANKIVNNR